MYVLCDHACLLAMIVTGITLESLLVLLEHTVRLVSQGRLHVSTAM